MSLFVKRQDYLLPQQSNLVLGGQARFQISREYPIECMFLNVSFNLGTTGAVVPNVMNPDGLLRLIRRVTLNGPDGARNRNVIDCSGPGLVELAKHENGFLDRSTQALIPSVSATAANNPWYGNAPNIAVTTQYNFVIPIFFCPGMIDDPLTSIFLLPVDRFNADPVLTVQIASANELDTGTAAVAIGTTANVFGLSLTIVRREVNRVNWPIVDMEIFEQTQAYSTTGDNQLYEIPITGYYTGILIRPWRFTSASADARGDISVTSAVPTNLAAVTNDWDIRIANNVLRRFRLIDIQKENDYSEAHGSAQGDVLAGSYFIDFVSDHPGGEAGDVTSTFGSLLNANIPLQSGTRIFLRQNIQQVGTGTQVNYVFRRFFANLNDLKL